MKAKPSATLEEARARLALTRSAWALHLRAVGGARPPSSAASAPQGLQEALRHWWQGHRLKGVADLLTPLIQHQARKHPAALLALAALAGAALFGLRPWRALPWLIRTAGPTLPLAALWQALQEALQARHQDPPSAP